MGVAILLVCYHHALDNLFTAKCSYVAVDVFFFLSGVGLLHSMRKNADLFPFWQRRIVRLFPTILAFFLVCTVLNFILPWGDVAAFYSEEAGMCRIFHLQIPWPHWYVVAIVIFYLLFPFFFYLAEKRGYLFSAIVFSGASYLVGALLLWSGRYECNIMVLRFPAGFLGGYMYHRYLEGKGYPRVVEMVAGVVSLASLATVVWMFTTDIPQRFFWESGLRFFPMLALGVCLAYALAKVLSWLPANTFGKGVFAVLSFVGAITLEIYLCDGVYALRGLAARGAGAICVKLGLMPVKEWLELALRLVAYISVACIISLITKGILKTGGALRPSRNRA